MTLEFIDLSIMHTKYSWLILIAATLALVFFIAVVFLRVLSEDTWQQAPNSRIALQLPKTFKPSDRFSGFIDDNSSASVVIIELPSEAYEQVKRLGDNPDALASQGVTDIHQESLSNRKGEHVYLRGLQRTPLVDYAKFILIFRENGTVAMITANVPEAALKSRAITEQQIEAVLASARVREKAKAGPVLFELGYLGDFEEDVALLGSTKGYRLKGEGAGEESERLRPFFLVAPSLHKLPVDAVEDTARKAFGSIEQFRGVEIGDLRKVQVAGMEAVEITGEAEDAQTGEAAGLYQLLIPAKGGGYFRLVGISPKGDMERYLPEFRKMAESFQPLTDRI